MTYEPVAAQLVAEDAERIQRIILLNYDSHLGYQLTAEQLEGQAAILFNQVASRRRTRAEHLNAMLAAQGYDRVDPESLDVGESEWADLVTAAGFGGEDILLDEAERGEAKLRQAYSDAIVVTSRQSSMSPVLNKQYGGLLKEWLSLSSQLKPSMFQGLAVA